MGQLEPAYFITGLQNLGFAYNWIECLSGVRNTCELYLGHFQNFNDETQPMSVQRKEVTWKKNRQPNSWIYCLTRELGLHAAQFDHQEEDAIVNILPIRTYQNKEFSTHKQTSSKFCNALATGKLGTSYKLWYANQGRRPVALKNPNNKGDGFRNCLTDIINPQNFVILAAHRSIKHFCWLSRTVSSDDAIGRFAM